jgi:dTDP-D-glucose 4,6-dehydratase
MFPIHTALACSDSHAYREQPPPLQICILDLARRIAVAVGVAEPGAEDAVVEYVSDRPYNDKRYAIDCTRVKALGWTPKVAFPDGLRRTIQWCLSHKDYWPGMDAALRLEQ